MLRHCDFYILAVISVTLQLTTITFRNAQLELPNLEIHVCWGIYLTRNCNSYHMYSCYFIALIFNMLVCLGLVCTLFVKYLTDNKHHWQFFYVLLTVHLSLFTSVINQLVVQKFCFTISLFHACTCFGHMRSSSRGQNCITQPLVSFSPIGVKDTRGCVMQFWPPDDEHMCPKHVQAWNKTYCKAKFLCIKLVKYWDKYTEMHGQQNVKILKLFYWRWRIVCRHHADRQGHLSYCHSLVVWFSRNTLPEQNLKLLQISVPICYLRASSYEEAGPSGRAL